MPSCEPISLVGTRNIDYAWEGLTVTGTGIPAGTGRVEILSTGRVRVR